jgi:hypothetical protein
MIQLLFKLGLEKEHTKTAPGRLFALIGTEKLTRSRHTGFPKAAGQLFIRLNLPKKAGRFVLNRKRQGFPSERRRDKDAVVIVRGNA